MLELFQNLTGPFFCDAVYSYVALVLAVARFFLCKMKSCLLHFQIPLGTRRNDHKADLQLTLPQNMNSVYKCIDLMRDLLSDGDEVDPSSADQLWRRLEDGAMLSVANYAGFTVI